MGFEYLEHTADVKVRASGKDFPEVCTHAVRGFTNVLTDVNLINPGQQFSVRFSGENAEHVLYALLEDLVYRKDTSGFIACSAILKLEGTTLSGTLYGDTITKYERSGDIKAITKHDLSVREEENGTIVAEFVLDI